MGIKLLLFVISLGAYSQEFCLKEYVEEHPPFFVSEGFGYSDSLIKEFENLRTGENLLKTSNYSDLRKKIRSKEGEELYLMRGSVVKVKEKFQKYIPSQKKEEEGFLIKKSSIKGETVYIPIEVLSTPNLKEEFELKKAKTPKIRHSINGTRGKKRAKVEVSGHFPNKSLRRIDGYSFLVREDSPFFKLPKEIGNKAVRFKKSGSKFKTEKCCKTPLLQDTCHRKYVFEIIGEKSEVKVSESCADSFIKHLLPIDTRDIEGILGVIKNSDALIKPETLVYLDSYMPYSGKGGHGFISGLVQMPHKIVELDNGYKEVRGPYNSYHYTGYASSEITDDLFLKPNSMCSFMKTLSSFQEKCKKLVEEDMKKSSKYRNGFSSHDYCTVQVGDMYQPDGIHQSHDSGYCVDVRPFNYSGSPMGLNVSSWMYNRKVSELFLKEASKYGAYPIYYDDYKSSLRNKIFEADGTHADHIHLCFVDHPDFFPSFNNQAQKAMKAVRNCQKVN